jgi:protein Tex
MNPYAGAIAKELKVRSEQVYAAVELLDEGNTIPFIARYRKEVTGVLDEEQLRQVAELLEKLRGLDERRATVLATIEAQGKLTPELKARIQAVETLTALEDLYLPYKPKRRTRATIARDNGLQGLADLILTQARTRETPLDLAKAFINEKVTTVEDALAGARDIVAETISDHADVRAQTRERALQRGVLRCDKIDGSEDPRKVFELYYAFELRVDRLRPHQVLAVNRGETEKVLRVKINVDDRDWLGAVYSVFRSDRRSPLCEQMELAVADAGERLLIPAIERDVRRTLTEKSEIHAITVFSSNLRALLSTPPLSGHVVLGLDPGFRTGCKTAVVDPTGKILYTGVIYPHEPQKKWKEALEILQKLVDGLKISLVAIGNGTASRETEQLVASLIKVNPNVKYLMVSEAGASVYSASPLARAEMPDLDVSLRGAVSIARRLQDALAELVKIDPKSIGVGMYQHDVDQAELGRALSAVIEIVVNQVGVDANTASPALLTHVSGLGPKLAERIVQYRDEHGPFLNRSDLKQVAGLGPKAFEQAAGFLRIHGGDNPLDASAIHPESYAIATSVLKKAGISPSVNADLRREKIEKLRSSAPAARIAAELGVGTPTLEDILEQLIRPGRDPRQDAPAPILRSDILSLTDLAEGMRLKGTVRNAVDFGSFVDIGVKQDGLLHRSQFPAGLVLAPGDIIDVEILKIEAERGRISLRWAGDW